MAKTNTEFLCIKDSKNQIDKFFREIKFKLDRLSVIYKEYIKKSNLSEEYLISLDTLNFQEILIRTDVTNYKNLYGIFLNQCYCQYFKLYQKIVIFLTKKYTFEKDITLDILTNKNFTIYKDLEEHKYEFTETEEIYQTICDIILYIKNYVNKQTYHLKEDEIKIQNGIYIQNLLYEKKHDKNYGDTYIFSKAKKSQLKNKVMIFTLGGIRTHNPQIRSLVRYPIAPRGQRTRPLPRLTQWQPSIFVTSLFIHLYFFISKIKLLPL